ncbi:MAG: hypothetical protein Q4P18_08340 [Methanobrevibacter sp.]|uniref:hypothetical protein n=1 Tax=Methanobrevibacter sp. TaxID=66852 RepID=UPI0026E053B6|nr:hypothetical protein [Methanobrevibacter sp.]MDO5849531.1 hypothetical protein [Methanobrevibacter sp.]
MGPSLLEEGIEIGEKNYLVKVAKRMLAKEYPIGEISEITQLSKQDILNLKNKE